MIYHSIINDEERKILKSIIGKSIISYDENRKLTRDLYSDYPIRFHFESFAVDINSEYIREIDGEESEFAVQPIMLDEPFVTRFNVRIEESNAKYKIGGGKRVRNVPFEKKISGIRIVHDKVIMNDGTDVLHFDKILILDFEDGSVSITIGDTTMEWLFISFDDDYEKLYAAEETRLEWAYLSEKETFVERTIEEL